MNPEVSIILPVYNAERFLAQTIDSLLQQTFTNFELLIINDGSSDDSEKIIHSYHDQRIRYLKNEGNKGLIYTLNRGIKESFGKFIARMDADDIAIHDRLEVQVKWLQEHEHTTVVGSFVTFIDELGNKKGFWPLDRAVYTADAIRKTMLKENCLAHPTVMMRAETIRKYLYALNQQHIEDYDLWLRLLANGEQIEKVPQSLLLYRVHQASITGTYLKKTNPYFKQFNCKRKVLLNHFKWNSYVAQLALATIVDGMMALENRLNKSLIEIQHVHNKTKIEDCFIFPFILLGRCIALCFPLKAAYRIYFFFPFYHTGGAEKVHALLAAQLGGKDVIVYFTRKSVDNTFLAAFQQSGCTIKDIAAFTDNKWLYFLNLICRGIISGYINRQPLKPVVFNGQCNFAYKLSPWVKPEIKQIELIHSFNSFSWIRLPFLPFIDTTVMISKVKIEAHLRQYATLQVPDLYRHKINHIVNAILINTEIKEKNFTAPLKVLYVGRGGKEKRVHLVAQIAAAVKRVKPEICFLFAGDVEQVIPAQYHEYCVFRGMIQDEMKLNDLYQQAHIVIITSETEGFPMVVEEGMANECAVVATPVGDLPVHVQSKVNGFLSSVIDEEQVIHEMTDYILQLDADRALLQAMGKANRQYALANFSLQSFTLNYLKLIEN